jgi:hypothetical protein
MEQVVSAVMCLVLILAMEWAVFIEVFIDFLQPFQADTKLLPSDRL